MSRVLLLLMLCVLITANGAAAQVPTNTGSASGLVLNESGNVRPGVPVRIQSKDGKQSWVVVSAADGTYKSETLAPGFYTIGVVGDGWPPTTSAIEIVAGTDARHHVVSRLGSPYVTALVVIAILAYVAALLAFRHHNIVRTNRELLCAQLENLAARISLEADPARPNAIQALTDRTMAVWGVVYNELPWREWFFWSRGREIGAWTRLHEVERQLVAVLVPTARVLERAVTAEADLRRLGSPAAVALADRIRETLRTPTPTLGGEVNLAAVERLREQLGEGLSLLYNESDTRFAALMEWHNKAMWLVYLALLVILAVSVVFHHEELFLIGAAGGLMSRMARALFREDVPNDYGASWTTLFLSPLLGAIAAWFGIALIMWLTEMRVFGDAVFGAITWHGDPGATLIGTAFVLGFSERLFTSLLSAVEGKVTSGLTPSGSGVASTLVPLLPGPSAGGAGTSRVFGTAGPTTPTREQVILRELDLQPGERVAFVGDPASATRAAVVAAAGADHIVDVTADTLDSQGQFDGVLIEVPLSASAVTSAAARLDGVLRPDARVVVVAKTPAAQFGADAETLRAQDKVGPALLKEVALLVGLMAQEPPVRLSDGDPVEWCAGFIKPSAASGDR